jgi:asparagine synthase (glutamine-hydrolysing)
VDQLESLLKQAVAGQMVADVPLGAFLSGGVDSSTVVALMQAQSPRPVKTFSIGFHEEGYNEAEHAKAVASHLGTEHTELYVTPQEAMAVIPKLPAMYDEPFSDSSQIPTHLVSRMARRHVTVALSGDAGDELFGGYDRYLLGDRIWRKLERVPKLGQRALASGLTAISPGAWDRLFAIPGPITPRKWRFANPGDMLQRMMYFDLVTYLPDDILVKVDRAAMAVSLETRIPMLDHRVVEYAWRQPVSRKIRNGSTKWLLRQVLYRHVPKHLIERPKMGFGVPIDSWLRGPLREWAESLLGESRLKNEGFLESAPIREKWAEHLSGRRNWQYLLWDVLMFQAWREHWGSAS